MTTDTLSDELIALSLQIEFDKEADPHQFYNDEKLAKEMQLNEDTAIKRASASHAKIGMEATKS